MHEACLNLLGKGINTPEGSELTQEVMDFMLKRIACYQEKTGNLFNLESTPAEGAAYKLALKDVKKYPGIQTSGSIDVPYYTNSTQLPAGYTDDLFEALNHQEPIQTRYTGGTVFHIFLGERIPDIASTKKLVRKVCGNFKLPYFTITPSFSICPEHGYINGEQYTCHICGTETEIYSRVVGYIRPVQQFNKGQQLQKSSRSTFDAAVGRKKVLELV
ncbi:anaerobic ribonucleoside-triphosphate reductase [Syntrophomonas palmitatica]|uniref:anaerobic ribonucleoside-triphosphate reductase n=1 Tax=Syntrophomonas palmitatica TaxID=402877 RepID=UPI0034E24E8A